MSTNILDCRMFCVPLLNIYINNAVLKSILYRFSRCMSTQNKNIGARHHGFGYRLFKWPTPIYLARGLILNCCFEHQKFNAILHEIVKDNVTIWKYVIPKRQKSVRDFKRTHRLNTRVFNTEYLKWLGLLPKLSKPCVKNTLKLGEVFSNMLLYVILKNSYGKQIDRTDFIRRIIFWIFIYTQLT